MLSKAKAEKEDEEHLLEMVEVISDAKVNVAVAFWEAKIHLAEDLENAGSWDMDCWHEALAKLTGKPAVANQDPILQLIEGREKKDADNDDQTKV